MKKWIIGVPLFLVFVIGVSIALYGGASKEEALPDTPPPEGALTQAARPGLAPAPPELEAVEAQKQALELELARARSELTGLRMKSLEDSEAIAETHSTPDKPESFMGALASMMDSPDMKDMLAVQSRMALDKSHGEFLRGTDLTPEDQDAFKDLLFERQMAMMSTGLRMWKDGEVQVPVGDESPMAAMDAFNQQMQELLGDEDYKLFERFEQTQQERMQVDMFKERLRGDMAIDWETQDRLIGAMADARLNAPKSAAYESMGKSMENGTTFPIAETMSRAVEHMEGINELYLEEAAAILNAEQYAAFEESLEQYAGMQRASFKMAEAMFPKPEKADPEE